MEPFPSWPDGAVRQAAAGRRILLGSQPAEEDVSVQKTEGLSAGIGRLCVVFAVLILISSLPSVSFADQPVPSISSSRARSAAAGQVTIRDGRILIDGTPFRIRGINYNPTPIGTDIIDPGAPKFDLPRIAALGANTVGTYHLGLAEWGGLSDVTTGEVFYDALYPVAEADNLKILVGYFSNHTMDWTNRARVARVTTQYQQLVLKARRRPSTLLYLIGNEVFEKLSNDDQRRAYAVWIGEMVAWTQINDPAHPVVYADSQSLPGLKWLKSHAPTLGVYGINNYAFTSPESLSTILTAQSRAWPGKPILLHEWGTDSWKAQRGVTDERAQSERLNELAAAVQAVSGDLTHPFIGSLYFAYNDEWRFVGSWSTQDHDRGWTCGSCFDGQADEDHWGLARAVDVKRAGARTLKQAYRTLQTAWGGR